MLTQNTVALRKGLVLFPNNFGAGCGNQVAASIQAELMQLGYMLDAPSFMLLGDASQEWAIAYHQEVVGYLRKTLGADRAYTPFYRNFPQQVMDMSNLELFMNAIVHYWSNGTWEPDQVLKDRGVAFENTEFKLIKLGTTEEFKAIFTQIVGLNSSLTEGDKEIVAWFIDTYGADGLTLPPSVPFKETLCILAAKGLDVPVKVTTDVLRVAVYMSGGDVSLPNVPKVSTTKAAVGFRDQTRQQTLLAARKAFEFKNFTRRERRMLVGLLGKTNLDVTDMQRHYGRWLRLGERLHVGEFVNTHPAVVEAFRKLREQPTGAASSFAGTPRAHVRTFNSDVDRAFAQDFKAGVDILAKRPGEFARRLDWLLRPATPKADKPQPKGSNILGDLKVAHTPVEDWKRDVADDVMDPSDILMSQAERVQYVMETFYRVGHGVSGKVLFEMWTHFQNRLKDGVPRLIRLKSKRSKAKALPALPALSAEIVAKVQQNIMAIIADKAAGLGSMGRVWVDERLKEVPLPYSMRSVNTSIRTYVRGTRIPFRADAKVVRAFIHWHDEHGHEDLDLSCGLYAEDLRMLDSISFTGLRGMGCTHSGDIRHRVGPCAEYVDIPLESAMSHGVRYAVVQVYNYNGRPMHTVKDCVFGLMEREHAQQGEIFVPKTISNCMGLANEGNCVVVCIIDLKEKKYIWADTESEHALPILERAESATGTLIRSLIQGAKMSVYDLLKLHVKSRGSMAKSPATAQQELRWEDFVTDYTKVAAYMNI